MNLQRPPRVGLMVPINNTTFEGELLKWLPQGASVTTLRIPRGRGLLTPETLPAYMESALELARQFADSDVDVVAYGCTAAGFISGPAGDAQLAKRLAQVTSKPVVTTARSMVLALQEIGARDIALITPYMHMVNDQLKAFLADGGIGVRRFDSFYAETVDKLGAITAPEVAGLARTTIDKECDAMFIACAQLPTFDILDGLRTEFKRPVLSSIEVTARETMRVLEAQPA
ncbi:MAG TPA: aspartate/glutamate racemase family protein [Burkholderiales bacterium]